MSTTAYCPVGWSSCSASKELHDQCDQMDKLVFQYLAIYNNENLSKIIQIDPKWVRNFAKNEINL